MAPNIPRRRIDTTAEIEFVRFIERVAVPDTPSSDHINMGFNGTVLTWVDDAGNVYTATGGGSTFSDAAFQIYDNVDPTKTFQFQASGITAGQNRVYTVPDANTTLVGTDTTQTLTNKSIVASQITAGTFTAGAYIFEHATATGTVVSLRSTDNSATNFLLRGLDSSSGVRWSVDYEGNATWGRTTGGAIYNGNIKFIMNDQTPVIQYRSGTTVMAQISSNSAVANGYLISKVGIWDALNQSNETAARFDCTNRRFYVGADSNASGDTTLWVNLENATTNATDNVVTFSHNSSGTPAASFGGAVAYKLESSTTTFTLAARLRWQWTVATHASRTARGILSAYDTAERDCIMWEASGSAPMLGFFGTSPIVKPTVTGSRGGNAALADLLTELAALGLIIDSSSA